MTYHYEVWVASQRYHKQTPLTYQSDEQLSVGSIILVPLQAQIISAVIYRATKKPHFPTKKIVRSFNLPPLPPHLLALIDWMATYYPAPIGTIVQQFIPRSLPESLNFEQLTASDPLVSPASPPVLTRDQAKAVTAIQQRVGTYLLHGDTGSGKTRVYQEIINTALLAGQSAIILTPEISLTTQLVNNLQQNSQARVVVMHSQLTESARRKVWLQLLTTTEPIILVGARSALFAPISNLGVIIIDEAHEPAYKQEQSPHYQTLRVASKLAQLTKSTLITGTATPNLSDYFWAEQKNIPILRMQQLAVSDLKLKDIEVIDLKNKSQFTHSRYLSDTLIKAVAAALAHHEQVLLFLNRRGSARITMCQNCGWQALCPNCDIPLVYHNDSHTVKCHLCNYTQMAVSACPVCHSTDILFKGAGTKAIIEEVARLFPRARTQRFDSDNKKAERFEAHYDQAISGDIDILVGTQTIAKGLDLPRLSLVGVISADTGLYAPDYTASERMYQLMRQVVGRVGRGHLEGTAIIQTYMPDNPILRAALEKNWQTFYELELAERKAFLYPPFCHLLKLNCRRSSLASIAKSSKELIATLSKASIKISLLGPAPAFHEKIGKQYNWQMVIKSKDRRELLKVIALLPSGWSYDIDPTNLL